MNPTTARTSTWRIILAFGCIYIIWGSTYLAIRFAIETLPPFFMAALRFAAAGAMVLAFAVVRGQFQFTPRRWIRPAISGILMLCFANGLVVWSEQTVPSGLASVLVGTMPLWMALMGWWFWKQRRPDTKLIAGLIIGLIGVAILIDFGSVRRDAVNPLGAAALLVACIFWSSGSHVSRSGTRLHSLWLESGIQMVSAACVLLLLSGLTGEWPKVNFATVSARSWLSIAYLVTFGSIIAMSAYVWLLKVCPPTWVSTYAYVNPIVALLLGYFFADESLTWRTAAASALVVGSVVLVTGGFGALATTTRENSGPTPLREKPTPAAPIRQDRPPRLVPGAAAVAGDSAKV